MVFGCEHIICPQVDSPPGIRPHRYIIKGFCIKRADQNGRINQAMIHPFINFIGSPGEIVEPDKGMLFLKCKNERGKTLRHHQLSAAHHDAASQLFSLEESSSSVFSMSSIISSALLRRR